MKLRYFFYLLVCLFFSCRGEDRRLEYVEQTARDRWIYDKMQEVYYWYSEMPDSKGLNYFQQPEAFLKSILSKSDSYSFIEVGENKTLSVLENSYGFEYTKERIQNNDTAFRARILYVLPESPASKAGLNRGDWISKIDGKFITNKNDSLLRIGITQKFEISRYRSIQDAKGILKDTIVRYCDTIINAPTQVINDPILYNSIIKTGKGDVGYLVCNYFSPEYDKALLDTLQKKFKDPENFILDLRYNTGGFLSSAVKLCTILAPSSVMGKKLGHMEFNDKFAPQVHDITLNADSIKGYSNMKLKNLYILTTNKTAGAAELVAHCLSGLSTELKVIIIGSTTAHKNVGSLAYPNEEENVILHPAVCKFYNSIGTATFDNGISPSTETNIDELVYWKHNLPLGNPEEILLRAALRLIDGNGITDKDDIKTITSASYNSLERRSIPSIIIDYPID